MTCPAPLFSSMGVAVALAAIDGAVASLTASEMAFSELFPASSSATTVKL